MARCRAFRLTLVASIKLHRVPTTEYAAIRDHLRKLSCIKALREDDSTS
jgi:hypothetical protein